MKTKLCLFTNVILKELALKCDFVGVHRQCHSVSALALNNTFVLLVAIVKAAFTLADSIFLSVILCFMLLKSYLKTLSEKQY